MTCDTLKASALTNLACSCSHKLVILSPGFWKRKDCVRELNTFMQHLHEQHLFCVLQALWGVDDTNGHNFSLTDLNWLRQGSDSLVNFLTQQLWPTLVKLLGQPKMLEQAQNEALQMHMEIPSTGLHPAPKCIFGIAGQVGG